MCWSKKYPKNGVFSFIIWLYVASRIFGFLPFSVEYNKNREWNKVKVTVLDWLWFVISISFYASAIAVAVHHAHFYTTFSCIEIIFMILTKIAYNVIAIFTIITDMINRKCIQKLISNFNEFDKQVI